MVSAVLFSEVHSWSVDFSESESGVGGLSTEAGAVCVWVCVAVEARDACQWISAFTIRASSKDGLFGFLFNDVQDELSSKLPRMRC